MLLLICLGLSLAACALPFLTGTVYFMVADDYLLNYIANGSYGLTNSDHLIFIRIPVGALLKALYSVTASVNWYMILLLAGTVLSFALLHTCVWKRTGSYPAMLLSLIINYITVAYFFSFTVVAFLCCAAGFAVLGTAEAGKKYRAPAAWCCAVLVLFGYCLRRHSLIVSAALFFPFLLACFLPAVRGCFASAGSNRSGESSGDTVVTGDTVDAVNTVDAVVTGDAVDAVVTGDTVDAVDTVYTGCSGDRDPGGSLVPSVEHGRKTIENTGENTDCVLISNSETDTEKDTDENAIAHTTPKSRAAALLKALKPYLIPAAAFILAFAAEEVVEKKAYSDGGWPAYVEYNDARSSLVDFYTPPYSQIRKEMKAAGISRLDYNLMVGWKFCEKDYFTKEKLQKAAEICKAGITMDNRIAYVSEDCLEPLLLFLLFSLMLLDALVFAGNMKRPGAAIGTFLISLIILCGLAFIRLRFVMRVTLPVELLTGYALLLLCDPLFRGRHFRFGSRRAVSICCYIMCLLFGLRFMAYYGTRNQVARTYCEEEPLLHLTEEIRSHPDTLYVMDAAVLSHQFYFGTPASRVLTTDLFRNVARSGSWDSYSPRYYSQLESCLDDPDNLLTAVVEDPDVMYVSMGGCSDIAVLYENRTGKTVSYEGREFPGRGITVWSLGIS